MPFVLGEERLDAREPADRRALEQRRVALRVRHDVRADARQDQFPKPPDARGIEGIGAAPPQREEGSQHLLPLLRRTVSHFQQPAAFETFGASEGDRQLLLAAGTELPGGRMLRERRAHGSPSRTRAPRFSTLQTLAAAAMPLRW